MQREAIIHIGTMKTGSTSIQNVCKQRRLEMLRYGAYYPQTPGPAAHILLTYAATRARPATRRPAARIWNGAEPEARLTQFRTDFAREMETLPPTVDRVIFSDERLSFALRDESEVAALRQLLAPFFSHFTIIAYLRRQDSLLASQYSELLRVGSVGEPDHIRDVSGGLRNYDFSHLLRMWAAVFGQDSVKPRLYDRFTNKSFDSVDDFLSACRLNIVVPADDPARTSNPSMNAAGQEVLREVGRVMQERMNTNHVAGPLWRAVSSAVTKALPGKGWLPTRDEAAAFMARFADGNEEIRRIYFPERATLFSDESAAFPLEGSTLTDRERFEAACLVLLDGIARQASAPDAKSEQKLKRATKSGEKTESSLAAASVAEL